MSELVKKCKELATLYHGGQMRLRGDDTGKPYIIHPSRIASKFDDEILKSIAWLHDVLEDTLVTMDILKSKDIPPQVLFGIKCLTRGKDETYFDFIMRIKNNDLARPVKIADIEDNMMGLSEGSLKDKYRFALYILKNKDQMWKYVMVL